MENCFLDTTEKRCQMSIQALLSSDMFVLNPAFQNLNKVEKTHREFVKNNAKVKIDKTKFF